jgi:hypothetical protein
LLFFRWVGPGVVDSPWRALTALPPTGADRTWLHQTLLEALSPWRQRWQRDVWVTLYGRETYLCPPTVLVNAQAAQLWCASEGQVRVRGSTRHADMPIAVIEESECVSNPRPGLREKAPPCSYACNDAGAT